MTTTRTTYRLRFLADGTTTDLYFRRTGRTSYGTIAWHLTQLGNCAYTPTEWRTRNAAERVAQEVCNDLHSFVIEEVTA